MGPHRLRCKRQRLQDRRLQGRYVPAHTSGWPCVNPRAGMVCTDAGITSNVILSEYGYGNFGAQYGGERTAWDISRAGLGSNLLPINLDTKVSSSDGQSVQCTKAHCPDDQAYLSTNDYKADRNSPLGRTYVHTFCP
jgi:hypothetical protein